ncbi:MAG: hypothetical protein ACLP5V_12605 [Candidatus Bathyarchaeia archaeon]
MYVTGRKGKFTLPLLLLTILLVLVPFQPVKATTTIMFDSSGSPNPASCADGSCGSPTTLSWSHTIGSGSNGILLVGLSHNNIPTASGVTFGAAALTLVGDHVARLIHVELWALLNPPAGSGTITVTMGFTTSFLVGGSVSYFNVASTISQLQAAAATNDGSGAGTATASDVVTTAAGDLVVDTLAAFNFNAGGGASVTVSPTGPGQAQLWKRDGPSFGVGNEFFAGGGSNQPASGSSVTMSWSLTTTSPAPTSWSLVAVPLTPTTTPIPEYPFGLPLLAILTIIGYGLVRRRTRT